MAFCVKCGSQVDNGEAFCNNCGAKIVSAPKSNSSPAPQPAAQPVQYAQPTQPAQPTQYAQPAQPAQYAAQPQGGVVMQKKNKAILPIIIISSVLVLGIVAVILIITLSNGSGSGTGSKPYIGAWAYEFAPNNPQMIFMENGQGYVEGDICYFKEFADSIVVGFNDASCTQYAGTFKYTADGNKLRINFGTSNNDGTNFQPYSTVESMVRINIEKSNDVCGVWMSDDGYLFYFTAQYLYTEEEYMPCKLEGNKLILGYDYDNMEYTYSLSGNTLTLTAYGDTVTLNRLL